MTDFADTHTQQALAGLGYLLLRSSADGVEPGQPLPMVQPPALPEETFMFVDADIEMLDFTGPRTPRPDRPAPEPVREPVLEQSLPVAPAVSYEPTAYEDQPHVDAPVPPIPTPVAATPVAAPPVDYPPSRASMTPVSEPDPEPIVDPDPEPAVTPPQATPVVDTPFIDYIDGGYRRGDSGSRMSDLADLD